MQLCTVYYLFVAEARSDLSYLLNNREKIQLANYKNEYVKRFRKLPEQDRNAVFFLGDNTEYSLTWSCHSGALPTFRRNSGFFWSCYHKRWMVAADKLSSLGFPTTQQLADILEIPDPLPLLDPTRAHSVCGNAMHLTNCMVVYLLAISCFGPSDEPKTIDWSKVPKVWFF